MTNWALFCKHYLPEDTVEQNAFYTGWEKAGKLTATPGNVTDYQVILDDLTVFAERFDIRELALDPNGALPLTNAIEARGLNMPRVQVRQNYDTFSPAMKEFEALVIGGKLKHDGDPVLAWMVSNVVCQRDHRDYIRPTKERNENKIDGVVAALMAMSRALVIGSRVRLRASWNGGALDVVVSRKFLAHYFLTTRRSHFVLRHHKSFIVDYQGHRVHSDLSGPLSGGMAGFGRYPT